MVLRGGLVGIERITVALRHVAEYSRSAASGSSVDGKPTCSSPHSKGSGRRLLSRAWCARSRFSMKRRSMDRDLKGQDQRFRGMKRLPSGRMFDLLSAGNSGRHHDAHPVDVRQPGRDVGARSPSRCRSALSRSQRIPPYRSNPSRFLRRCRPAPPLLSGNAIRSAPFRDNVRESTP